MRRAWGMGAAVLLAGWAMTDGAAAADSGKAFSWPRLTVYVGFSPFGGVGGYDTYGRELSRWIGKYLPGAPTAVVENRPGAGGLTLMNYMYNQAPHDGTEIALVASGNVMDPLLMGRHSNARFDPGKFNWIGSMNRETAVFAVMQKPPIALKDILGGKPIDVGATGTASDNFIYARLMQTLLHTHMNVIPAYPGMNEVEMAMNNGEIAGVPGVSWDSLRFDKADWLSSGRTKPVLQFALQRSADLSDVPLLGDLIQNPQDKAIVDLVLARQSMGRPFVTAPGVPADRVETLRQAFDQAMRDPQLIAECAKMNLVVKWNTGAEVQQVVDGITHAAPEVVARAQTIFEQQ